MKIHVVFLSVLIGLSTMHKAVANDSLTETEARYLVKVTQELSYLQRLVEQARYHRNPAAANQVDYDALQSDLETIRSSLNRHINKPSRVPRQLPPLKSAEQ